MAATILVVDDDHDLREYLTALLAIEGYAVFSANDEEQALALFEANEIDLVIVDLLLPKINGVTLLKRFKKIRPDIGSVIYSAMLGHNYVSGYLGRLVQLADRVLEKPMRAEDFLAEVRSVLALKGL